MLDIPKLRTSRARGTAAVAFWLFAGAAQAQPGGLSLDAALAQAMARSSALQAAQSSVSASAEAAIQAGQLPDPMLRAGVDNLPINGAQRLTIGQDFMTMRHIGIAQEWVSKDKRELRTAVAERRVERERAAYLAQITRVRQQTAAAWLNAAYAERELTLYQTLADHMAHESAAAQASYRGSRGSAGAVAQTRTMLAQARDQVLKAQQSVRAALIALSRWTAQPVAAVSEETPSLDSGVPALSLDELDRVQPTLIAAAATISYADADTALAERNRTPNWTWELSYQKRGGQYSDMVSFGVSIPLPLFPKNRQDRDVAEKSDLGTTARLMLEDARRDVQAQIQTAATALHSGRERLASLKSDLLPAAHARVRLATSAYRSGAGALSDVFAAIREELDAQLQVLELEREVALTWAQLEYEVVPPTLALAQ